MIPCVAWALIGGVLGAIVMLVLVSASWKDPK